MLGAEVLIMIVESSATLVPLILGLFRYITDRQPRTLADSTKALTVLPPTTAELGPHLALEIITGPTTPGGDEISEASKAAQRRIDRLNSDDWDQRYAALLAPVTPPQPTPDCTCEWVDATTLSGHANHIHAGYAADCPDHQPPESRP